MTFQNAPWAIDGALLNSALARRSQFAATSGSAGIVQRDDLKVTPLDTPGVGVQIAPGVGLVLNDYQTLPNESYVASNPGVHVIPSGEMPASNPSAKSYIVAVVIGDPDFSQVGHPWMGVSDPPVGEETTFQYVRPTIIEVSAGATDIPGAFPALPLARLDIPANTTTITGGMIVDLRKVANPRSQMKFFTSATNAFDAIFPMPNAAIGNPLSPWGETQFKPQVLVPSWAKRAVLVTDFSNLAIYAAADDVQAVVANGIGSTLGPSSAIDLTTGWGGGGSQRLNVRCVTDIDVTSIAGTLQYLRMYGLQYSPNPASPSFRIMLFQASLVSHDLRFFEE